MAPQRHLPACQTRVCDYNVGLQIEIPKLRAFAYNCAIQRRHEFVCRYAETIVQWFDNLQHLLSDNQADAALDGEWRDKIFTAFTQHEKQVADTLEQIKGKLAQELMDAFVVYLKQKAPGMYFVCICQLF